MASYKYELENDLELEEPKKYKVLLLNDDFSTMEFVIEILTKVTTKKLNTFDTFSLAKKFIQII